MRVYQPEFHCINKTIQCSARIKLEHATVPVPPRLIYRFPASYENSLSRRGDAFVAALLPLAMHLEEELFYDGIVSAQLLHGMQEWVRILSHWEPKLFSPIQIHVGGVLRAEPNPQAGIVLPFSGGVDSLYTLHAHLPPQEMQTENQVKHALFVHGFDVPLNMPQEYDGWAQRFENELAPLNVPLIRCATNAQAFTTGMLSWGFAHGAILASFGLLLEPICRQLVISSTDSLSVSHVPWGSSPLLDYWLSSEAVSICNFGCSAERLEKIEKIAHWQPAVRLLRVCIDPRRRQPGKNCSRCEKCLRTGIILHLLGVEGDFQTFEQSFLLTRMLGWFSSYWLYLRDLFRLIGQRRQYQYLPLAVWCSCLYYARTIVTALTPRAVFHWLKNKIYPLEQNLFCTAKLPEEWRG